MIKTAAELHRHLTTNRNFDFKPDLGRDSALYNDLKRILGLPPGKFLEALSAQNVSAEQYLRALLEIAEPLSKMYRDIFDYCSRTNFLRSKNSNKIEWEIGLGQDSISLCLENFRLFDEIKTRIQPSFDLMFSTKNDIMNWLAHDVFKPNHSGLLSSDYDWNGIEIFRILASARDRLGSEFEGIFKGLNNYYIGNNTKKLPRSQASSVTGHKDYQEKLSAVSIAFDPVDIELIASNLIELPFWKFRWQIYEIWIITVSLSEFEKLGFQLSASRDGNSLVELGRQTTLAIHENTPKTFIYQPTYQNRNHAEIRPDIVISSAANATSNNVELIIECKQRVSLDTPHLDSVKDKYESGVCQLTGEVLIVNYDDATPWSRSSQDKTTLIANVRPDSSGDIEFRKLLRSTLIAKSLRKEIWLIDISKSMEILLNDDFRQLLEKRMDSLSPSMMELYGFAQKIEARQPSDIRGEVSMSVSPNDPNWEVLGINRLCDKVREYLKEKNVRLFIVSDLASKINMQLSLGEDERDYVSFIDPITIDSINESII